MANKKFTELTVVNSLAGTSLIPAIDSMDTTPRSVAISNTNLSAQFILATAKAAASGIASLDGSSLVVQNPANATATPTANKIPIADGSGKLDSWITAGGGTGDCIAPASSTDNTIARFNGTDNKTIQGSLITIDDNGTINIPSGQTYKINGTALSYTDVGAQVAGTYGDTTGAASSTDNAIVRFDSTGGKTLQNSLVTIDDSGSVNIPSGQAYKINGTALAYGDVGAQQAGSYQAAGNYAISPTTSADNVIPRFDGTDNKTLQVSLVTIDDNGTINIPSSQSYKINGTALSYTDVGAQVAGSYEVTADREAASGYAGLDANSKVIKDPANATATPTASKIVISDAGGKVDGWVSAASDTVAGIAEIATTAETSAGSDTGRVVTPDGLAGSIFGTKNVSLIVIADATAVATGDGQVTFVVPIELNGMNLVSVGAHITTTSSSGNPAIQIRNVTDSVDMLSTGITIDATEYDSKDATTAAVIDTAHDDVATGDVIAVDVDTAGTGTKGLQIRLGFRMP